MQRNLFAICLSIVLIVLVAVAAAGQGGPLAGLAQPIVVNIEQAVPVDVTLALPQADGSVVTTTAPITVGVALQIKLDGAQVVAVTVPAADTQPTPTITIARPTPMPQAGGNVDDLGLAWRLVDTTDTQIELEDWAGYKSQAGYFAAAGRLRNLDPVRKFSLASIVLKFFDGNGRLVAVEDNSASGHWVGPGEFATFSFDTRATLGDIANYTIEILGNDWQE